MSHFTNLKTSFKNLFHLENALNKLKIEYRREEKLLDSRHVKFSPSKNDYSINLVISTNKNSNIEDTWDEKELLTSNVSDIIFNWNGEEYELIFDASFWIQPYSVEKFINKISQQYANSVIVTESQKIGFQPIKSKQHIDGSTTIILQRWNTVIK
jgi:hypothetical protein